MHSTSDKSHRWGVLLAGGDGTRLQELTRRISGDKRPKQFCPLFEGKSLLDNTRERIAPIFRKDRTVFALARAHECFYRSHLADVRDGCKVIQPGNRGTAVAMALCLRVVMEQDEDAVVAFFPSDHHYLDNSAFREHVEVALNQIEEYPHSLLILGAEARYPELEYGWIEPGRTLVDSSISPLLRVSRFWETPEPSYAETLHRRGYLWNTFVTIGLAGAFVEMLQATVPHLMRSLDDVHSDNELERFYESVAPIDFSRAVLTRMPERLIVLRDANSGWTDLGSPDRVMNVFGRRSEVSGSRALRGHVSTSEIRSVNV